MYLSIKFYNDNYITTKKTPNTDHSQKKYYVCPNSDEKIFLSISNFVKKIIKIFVENNNYFSSDFF